MSKGKKRRIEVEVPEGQPVIRSSLKRLVYATERTEEGVTGLAGVPTLIEVFHALGLAEACQREVQVKKRDRGPRESEWVEMFIMLHLSGGQDLEDIKVLKQDDGLRRVWPVLEEMSPRSALDFLMRFEDPAQEKSVKGKAVIRPETAGLAGLARVNRHLLAEVQRRRPVKTATLDIDASIHACDKKEALRTYEGPRGYQPTIAYWKEQKLVAYDQFRDGNVPAGMGTAQVVKEAIESLPSEGIEKVRVRGDSALYEHETLRYCDRNGVEFGISADVSPEFRAEIEKLDDKEWRPLNKRDGTDGEPGRMWAEVPYVPDDPVARKGEKPFRYMVIRLPQEKEEQLDLFGPPRREYVAVVTNRKGPGDEIIHWHREKCGTVEHAHDVLKHDVGARLFPSSAFGANAAWYRLAILAMNLHQAVVLLGMPQEWQGHRISTMRFRLWNRAGRVIRKARRHIMVLSALAAEVIPVYLAIRSALAAAIDT